jgi:hypothetical protein
MNSNVDRPSADVDESRGKRGRSPNYPAVNLETAIKWTKQVYDGEKRTPTTPLIVAQRCGFNGLNGPSRGALSALKKYGLLVDADNDRIRVSDEALKLFLQPDENERLKLVQSFALRPNIVRDILGTYHEGLPSQDTLRYHLITSLNFTEDGASTFLRLLLENIEFAKLEPSAYNSLVNHTSQIDESPAKHGTSSSPATQGSRPASTTGANSVRFELSGGTLIVLDPSKPLTAEAIEELVDYLSVYKKVLSKQSQVVASQPSKE